MGNAQPVIHALTLHLIFLFHMELLHEVSTTRTTKSTCNQQADTKDYISINSGSKKVYQKQVILCDPKNANLNSKKHNPNKLLGFSASTFAKLQQKHHVSTGVASLQFVFTPFIRHEPYRWKTV
jgi:hypothetical protein